MSFSVPGTSRAYSRNEYVLAYPKAIAQRPSISQLCEVFIFILRTEPRVFIAGGRTGFDSTAREADVVEIEALAERFDLPELREVLARRERFPGDAAAR